MTFALSQRLDPLGADGLSLDALCASSPRHSPAWSGASGTKTIYQAPGSGAECVNCLMNPFFEVI